MDSVGFVYVMGSVEMLTTVKVGSCEDWTYRRNQLQTGSPYELHVWAAFNVTHGSRRKCESLAHAHMSRFCFYREWFNIHPEEAKRLVWEAVQYHDGTLLPWQRRVPCLMNCACCGTWRWGREDQIAYKRAEQEWRKRG